MRVLDFTADILVRLVPVDDDCDVGQKGRKACANCTCGRAELEDEKAQPETKLTLGQISNPQSACGNVSYLRISIVTSSVDSMFQWSYILLPLICVIIVLSTPFDLFRKLKLTREALPVRIRGCFPLQWMPLPRITCFQTWRKGKQLIWVLSVVGS